MPDNPPMTPERLRECMETLNTIQWTSKGLARAFGFASGTSWRDKRMGKVRILPDEAEWIEKWMAFFQANPPPARPKISNPPRRENPS